MIKELLAHRRAQVFRLEIKQTTKAKVKPRGIHNLRSAVDTNLVAAGVSLDLAICVTGHTREVAEKHYLKIDQKKQRQTISRLAALYSETPLDKLREAVREVRVSLTTDDAQILKNWILSEGSKENSGANTRANFNFACKPLVNNGLKNMAERQGDTTREVDVSEITDNTKDANNDSSSISAISAVFAKILEQILEQG